MSHGRSTHLISLHRAVWTYTSNKLKRTPKCPGLLEIILKILISHIIFCFTAFNWKPIWITQNVSVRNIEASSVSPRHISVHSLNVFALSSTRDRLAVLSFPSPVFQSGTLLESKAASEKTFATGCVVNPSTERSIYSWRTCLLKTIIIQSPELTSFTITAILQHIRGRRCVVNPSTERSIYSWRTCLLKTIIIQSPEITSFTITAILQHIRGRRCVVNPSTERSIYSWRTCLLKTIIIQSPELTSFTITAILQHIRGRRCVVNPSTERSIYSWRTCLLKTIIIQLPELTSFTITAILQHIRGRRCVVNPSTERSIYSWRTCLLKTIIIQSPEITSFTITAILQHIGVAVRCKPVN
ncbi:hypothetical protein J6590_021601 [Homalodisca vitripennis]|nr:hypothetical protein J6590_021601 [Homalodisca vitripennis]